MSESKNDASSRSEKWLVSRYPGLNVLAALRAYKVPDNLNLWYCFGAVALFALCLQLLSGIWLVFFYDPTNAFASVQYIMREVEYGWLIRYAHTTGASMLFAVLFVHLLRAMVYGSYRQPRELVWLFGMVLLLLMMAEAFMGYLLPWGQMSYWGAKVILTLVESLPWVGNGLLQVLQGGELLGEAALKRFYVLHILLVPMVIALLVYLHIGALHSVGANNPEGRVLMDRAGDSVPRMVAFHPYYTLKDAVAVVLFLLIFAAIIFYAPMMGGVFIEPANAVAANPMVTPAHVSPPWYFSPFYSMLRVVSFPWLGVEARLWGGLTMMFALLMLLLLPWLDRSPERSLRYKGRCSRVALAIWVISLIGLGVLGCLPLTEWRIWLARLAVILYFLCLVLMPWYSRWGVVREAVDAE
ncbi:cytochrome b [Pokkaliibacter sp. CJK22405]|uniref:cytochrome b n=1 Tax=Pokkaliibacter sp. CJK22405 TaxID=3384615 RepID=UPI003985137A